MEIRMKMILADDEVVITKGIQKLVDWNALGITIIGVYEDGKSAFEAIVRNQPELALLDISMPGMTGIDIIRECAALKLDTQFIFISGFQDFEYAKSAIKYGAVDYLLKPIILEELMHAVEQCITNITGIRKEPERLFMENRNAFTRLVEVENTCYVPVLADIVYPVSMGAQMKKLVQFSFYSFVDEYIGRLGAGITFNRAEKLVIVWKGMEREQCFEEVQKLQKALEENIRQKSMFIVGQLVDRMSDIPNAYEKCAAMSGYFSLRTGFRRQYWMFPARFMGTRFRWSGSRMSGTRWSMRLLTAAPACLTNVFRFLPHLSARLPMGNGRMPAFITVRQ